MASQVDICNSALSLLGDDIDLVSITDNTKQGKYCKLAWDSCVESILRAYPWGFAVKRYSLAKTTETPVFGYGNIFVYPSDCLRIVKIDGNWSYTVEGNRIYSEADTFNFWGIYKVKDTSIFSSDFVRCLIYLLASEICLPICGRDDLKKQLYEQYMVLVEQAKTSNSFESSPRSYTVHGLIDSREIGAW